VPVQLVTVPLDQPADVVGALTATLEPSERQAAEARRPPARRRYVVAHGALRAIVGGALDIDPAALTFDRTCRHCGDPSHGKPRVSGPVECSFNLSHSGGLAAVALIRGPHEVGVDIEERRNRRHLDRLAARTMTPTEYDEWRALPGDEQLDAFLRTWTAKEAFAKATGHGLVRPLRETPAAPAGWRAFAFAPATDVVGTVVVDAPDAVAPVARPWDPRRGFSLVDAW
jgi:4'-phosphopantetheinyl transferase